MKIITKKMVLILALLLCLIFLSSCATVRSLLIYMNGGREDYYISGIDAHLEPDHVVFESTVNFYHEQKDVLYKYEYTNADFHFFNKNMRRILVGDYESCILVLEYDETDYSKVKADLINYREDILEYDFEHNGFAFYEIIIELEYKFAYYAFNDESKTVMLLDHYNIEEHEIYDEYEKSGDRIGLIKHYFGEYHNFDE